MMNWVQTAIIAGLSFFLSAGISFAAEMDDLDLTIRVIESDDVEEIHHELSLPDMASETAREHAEDEDGKGLTQANAVREREDEHEPEQDHEDEARDEEREEHEDEREDHEDEVEDHEDSKEEHDDAHEEESHEEEHENESPEGSDS